MITSQGRAKHGGTLETLGGRIRFVREGRGIALGEAARAIKVSRTSFGQWEAGNVLNPDVTKLTAFTKLTDVSLDWLIERKGPDPEFGSRSASRGAPTPAKSRGANHKSEAASAGVPEVSPSLAAHAAGFDLTPRTLWDIPQGVLELAFHSTPGHTIIMRVGTRIPTEFGLQRDDYTLIDTTRDRIDEPGIYILADPDEKSARRAFAVEERGNLTVSVIADDLARPQLEIDSADFTVLGRIMGTFRPL